MSVIKRPFEMPQTRINTGFLRLFNLLPLDRSRWFRGQVIQNPVDAFHLSRDPSGDLLEQRERKIRDRSRHRIYCIDGPQDHRPFKCAGIISDTHRLKVRNRRKILPYLSFQTGFCKFFPQDCIRFPDRLQTVTGNRTQTTHPKTRTRERLAANQAPHHRHEPHL